MAIKFVKPEDRAANPIAQLASQADQADQQQAADITRQNRLAALLPPDVRAAKKKAAQAQLAQDTGEDPRVTKFLASQTATSNNSLLAADPIRRAAQKEKATQQFFAKNPDLDPRIGDQTLKVKDKSVPAEKSVQNILRILTTPDEQLGAQASLTKRAVRKEYGKIKDQLTPELRTKYNLDEAEKAGLFQDGPGGFARTVGAVVQAPGIKQTLEALDLGRSYVASGVKQAGIGLEELTGAPGHEKKSMSFSEFAGDAANHIGFGDVYTQGLKRRAEATGGSAAPFGIDAYGLKTNPETGNAEYNRLGGRMLADTVGAAGDVAGDPLTYVSFGSSHLAKSGLQTLEKEGLGDVANLIRKGGMKSLDETQLAAVREVLLKTKGPIAKNVAEYGADAVTKVQMDQLAKGGQKGLKFGGKTVVPFSGKAGVEEAKSVASQVVTSIPTHDIQVGDHFTRDLAGSVVKDYNHDTRLLTIDPGNATAVVRKGEPIMAHPGTFRVGDELMDGNAKITHIADDGTVTLKLDNQLESIERPFGIIPRREVDMAGTQGTLMGTKEVPAPPPVYQQGTLLSQANEVPALAGVPKIAQDAFDTEAADNLLRVADQTAPQAVDDVVRAGDQFIYRDADGKAAGILSIADDKVETLYVDPALRGQGIADRLYGAADEAGIDVSKLGADEVTPAGQGARARYLENAGKLPGRGDTATTYRVTKDGGTEPTRLWRIRTRDGQGEYVLKNGEHIVEPVKPTRQAIADAAAGASKADVHAANSGIEVGEVVGRTPEGDLLLKPAMGSITQTKVGEHVPGLYGTLEEILPDGTWRIKLDPTLFKKTAGTAAEVLTHETYVAKAVAAGLDPAVAASVPKVAFQPAEAQTFHDAVEAAQAVEKKGRKVGETVYRYSVEEYADMKTFLSPDGKTGFAVKSDGDLVSVFNVGQPGAGESAVVAGIGEGATKLDAFDESGFLPEKYAKFGFTETGRDAWNPEFAPEGWKGGQPDVVYMERAAVSPAAAPEAAQATTLPLDLPQPQAAPIPAASGAVGGVPPEVPGQTALFPPGPGAPLPNVPPYPPRPTVLEDIARSKAGQAPREIIETPEAQQKLFDLGIAPVRDLKPGDRIRYLGAEVVENKGRRTIVAKMDDTVVQVIRDDQVLRLDAADLKAGDELTDSGMKVVSRNADGTLTLKGLPPIGAKRVLESVDLGGIPLKPNFRDKLPGVRGVRDAFAPRASVEAASRRGGISAGAGDALYRVQSGERAALGNALNDKQLQFHSVETRMRKALGREEAARVLSDAFDVAQGEAGKAQGVADALRAEAKAAESPNRATALNKAADAIETMDQLRKEIHSIGQKTDQGAFDLGVAGEHAQMPAILTAQGKKILGLQPNIKDAFGIERQLDHLSQGFDFSERAGRGAVLRIEHPGVAAGLQKEGSFIEIPLSRSMREINAASDEALNEATRQALGLADGESAKMFEENALTAYSYRNRTAQTIAIEQDMMAAAEEAGHVFRGTLPKANDGASQAAHDAWKKTVPEHYVEVKGWSTPGEITYADPAVAKEMSKVRALLRNDEELKAFKKIVDQASALWTRQVLSPITKGFGQQMRNLQSNIINATFGGLTLNGQKEAIRLQSGALRNAGKLMKTEGLSFDAALAKLGLEAGGRDATLLRYLREDDILNTGLYRVLDWGDTTGDKLGGTLKDVANKRLNPLSGRNVLFAPGRAVNTAIEDNGRMALYISVFDKTGSREAAIEAVHKYLFDYADLTTFESHVMKNVNAFYTYMRKNTALQLRVFAERPALPLTVLKAKASLTDSGQDNLLAPGEARDRGLFQAGGALQAVIGGKGVVGIDDPVTAAIRTIDPFIQGSYYTIDKFSGGKLSAHLPPAERPTGSDVAKGFIGLTAGAPAEAMTTIAEVALGRDLRTDRDLKESDTFRKLVSAVAPVWDQATGVKGMATGDRPLRTNLLRMFAGITAYNREGEKAQNSLNYAMLNELDETIKLLQAQGVEVPTMSDLQDAGLIPTASDIKKARTVPLTPAMKKEAARKKLGLTP